MNKGVLSQFSFMALLPNKHHSSPGGQGGSLTPTLGGKTCHLPSLVAPLVTQKAGSQGLRKGVFLSQEMLGSANKLLVWVTAQSGPSSVSGFTGTARQCLSYQSVVLHLRFTCSLPTCDEGIVTSNMSAGVLQVYISFDKLRAKNNYNTPQTIQMLSSELRFP